MHAGTRSAGGFGTVARRLSARGLGRRLGWCRVRCWLGSGLAAGPVRRGARRLRRARSAAAQEERQRHRGGAAQIRTRGRLERAFALRRAVANDERETEAIRGALDGSLRAELPLGCRAGERANASANVGGTGATLGRAPGELE